MEKPILFSGEMVRAILEGRKTQTRRVVKPQPWEEGGRVYWTGEKFTYDITPGTDIDRCPFGRVGDRLWVKETFALIPLTTGEMGTAYRADGEHAFDHIEDGYEFVGKWKPSTLMPRKASRITLEITGVRVERLKDINEGDAKEEGIEPSSHDGWWKTPDGESRVPNPVNAYKLLWESINGKGSWDKNPWVWVIEFKKL